MVKMHKLRKCKTKFFEAKYRNNDCEKRMVNCTKKIQGIPGQNSEGSKFQDRKKFQVMSTISTMDGHPV